jgi:hypothetical protein
VWHVTQAVSVSTPEISFATAIAASKASETEQPFDAENFGQRIARRMASAGGADRVDRKSAVRSRPRVELAISKYYSVASSSEHSIVFVVHG